MKKSVVVPIGPEGGRDAGKVFVIVEPSAIKREAWVRIAVTTLLKSGIDFPDGGAAASAPVFDVQDVVRLMGPELATLYDQLLSFVKIRPDPTKPAALRDTVEDDFEELKTLVRLRMEVFQVLTGFRLPDRLRERWSLTDLAEPGCSVRPAPTTALPEWATRVMHSA